MWCGHHSVQYHVFVTACKNILHGRYEIDGWLRNEYAVQSTCQVSRLVGEGIISEDMCTLLWNFHESACSEERDRFGALYCLVPRDLQPTLDLGAPFPRIFEQFAVNQMNVDSTSAHRLMLHLLSFGSLHDSGQIDASSWIPDWSQKRHSLRQDLCIHTIDHEPFFYARTIDSYSINYTGESHSNYRDIQYRWYRFIKDKISVISRCTYLSAHYEAHTTEDGTRSQDQNMTAILRIRWFHPFAGICGMTINSVVTASDWMPGHELPTTFIQELQSMVKFSSDAERLYHLSRFILETTIRGDIGTWVGLKTDLDSCFAELSHDRRGPIHDISSLLGGKFILCIAELLHASDLAILEWRHSDKDHHPMFALGPTNVVKGDYMIPLACSSVMKTVSGSTLWVRRERNQWFENFIAIRPCRSSESCQSTEQDVPVEPGKPRKASFLGLCLAYFDSLATFYDIEGRAETVKLASELEDGLPGPPPYVFDII